MALENVLNEILAQARRESKKIIDDGKREAEAIVNDAKKEAKEKSEKFKKETEKLIEETKMIEISNANLKISRTIMEFKNNFLNETFVKLTENINKINTNERKIIIERLLKKAIKELDDSAFVYTNSKDKKYFSKFKKIKFNGTIDVIGGIIVENRKRDIRLNYTFETFLQKLKETYLIEISKRLFEFV